MDHCVLDRSLFSLRRELEAFSPTFALFEGFSLADEFDRSKDSSSSDARCLNRVCGGRICNAEVSLLQLIQCSKAQCSSCSSRCIIRTSFYSNKFPIKFCFE